MYRILPLILATLASKLHIAAAGQKQLPALFGHLQNQGDPMFTPPEAEDDTKFLQLSDERLMRMVR